MRKLTALICGFMICHTIIAQDTDTLFLDSLLHQHPELFSVILDHPQKHEVQILYTQIDRDQQNVPHFKSYSYRLDPEWYFYPASTVKLPACIFALEKLRETSIPGLDKHTSLQIDTDLNRFNENLP